MQPTSPEPHHPLYLVRHARCGDSGTLLGAADPPLTPEGRAESFELARRLRGRGIGRIVSSTLRRAKETAGIVAAELELPVDADQRLNEISYGPWDGLRWAEIETRFPKEAASKLADWFHFTVEGAEPFSAFFERVKQAWNLIRDTVNEPVAVVAHRTVNAVLLALSENPQLSIDALHGSGGERIYRFEQAHASFIVAGASMPSPPASR